MKRHRPSRSRRGFSLMETLVLVTILGIVGAAAGRSLTAVSKAPRANDVQYQLEGSLVSKMEELRSKSFDSLALGSPNGTLSDTVTINNTTYTRSVNITTVSGFAANQLKQIQVVLDGKSVTTLVAR